MAPNLLQKRIHEWSKTLPDWQRDLLRRLAAGPLSDQDRVEVRAILTGTAGAPAAVPLELTDLPADEDEHGCVELRSLGSFRNINCLAEDQTLPLQSGLNVVFGKNGTGKTGHGRLLRGVCRAAEREDILRNVFEPAKTSLPQTADITISVDDVEQPLSVDLAKPPERILSSISVFDASCARIFLTKPNTIDYVPRPLIILKSLAEEQDTIAAGLRSDAEKVRVALPQLPEIDPGTKAGDATAALGASTDMKQLDQLATLNKAETAQLEELETAAAAVRADKSGELETAARTRAAGARAAATAIREAATLVDLTALNKITDLRSQLDATTQAERKLADQAFSGKRFPGAGQDAWREMWFAAQRYVEAGGGSFPNVAPGAACPFCEQELDEEAASRLSDLEKFVRSDLRERAGALEKELQTLLRTLPDTAALKSTVTSELRGRPEPVVAAAYAAVAVVEARVAQATQVGSGEQVDELPAAGEVDLSALDDYATQQTNAAETQASLRDADKQREVLSKLAELRARQLLHTNLPKLKKLLQGLKAIAAYHAAETMLGTQGISNQLRKLQEVAITDRLRTAMREEIEQLNPAAGQIELVGQANKGETVIQLRLRDGCRQKIDRVLSAGEQGALGTAFFLAEIAVSEGKSAIVLDDPVSSLDHDHREYLARRLVHESTKRQVVIYTHDLTFLFYLQEAAESAGVELCGQTLERSLDEVGIVREGLPTKTLAPSARRKELRKRLRFELTKMFEAKKPEYEREADLWETDLRDGYDQVIEEYVLAGTVRRYQKNVRIRQLYKLKWSLEIVERIDKAMKQASPKSHFEPLELYPRAHTPDELGAMLDEFDAICDRTAPKQEKQAEDEDEQTTFDKELVSQAQAAGLLQAS
jgi:ABC-type transport system involved in cytochrome c biogenesis ATPase subunit